MTRARMTRPEAEKKAADQYVYCKGWSPKYGPFGKIMLHYGYSSYWIAAALDHPDSGCKNVSMRALTAAETTRIANQLLAASEAECSHLDDCDAADASRVTAFPPDAPATPIGEVSWEYHMPGEIHIVSGAPGHVPRWVRCMAAIHWPEAEGIQLVRVRVYCTQHNDFAAADNVQRVLLDLSPEHMGIEATHVGRSNCWSMQ